MITKNIFSNICPLDHRYYLANRAVFDELAKYLSEEAVIRYSALAEAALVKTHVYLNMEHPEQYYAAVDEAIAKDSSLATPARMVDSSTEKFASRGR